MAVNVIKSNKFNQCDFASFQAGDLRRNMKTYSGERPKNAASVTNRLMQKKNISGPVHNALNNEN